MPYGYGSQGPAGGASSGGNYGGNKNPNQNYGGNNTPSGDGGNYSSQTSYTVQAPKKKSILTKIKDGATKYVTARRKQAYEVANIIPGNEKALVRNRTDYRNYLSERGNTPDFLNVDDKTLASFDTYEQVRNYKPTQTGPNSNTLNYADYLAEEKGNYNLQKSGNVGGMNNEGGGNNTPTIIKKNIGGNTILTTSPTEAEVSQSEAANADAAALKVKKRGRSASIMTGPKGVTKTSTDYSLGMKSLLGRV